MITQVLVKWFQYSLSERDPNLLPMDYSRRPDELSCFAGLCIRPRFQRTLAAYPWNHHRRTFLFPWLDIFISWKSTFRDVFPAGIFDMDSKEHWPHASWLNFHHYSRRYVGWALCWREDCRRSSGGWERSTFCWYAAGSSRCRKRYCCGPGVGGEERPPGGAIEPSPTEHPEFRSWLSDNSEGHGSLKDRARQFSDGVG